MNKFGVPVPSPPTSNKVVFNAEELGFSLKTSEQTLRKIEEIERNSALAAHVIKGFLLD